MWKCSNIQWSGQTSNPLMIPTGDTLAQSFSCGFSLVSLTFLVCPWSRFTSDRRTLLDNTNVFCTASARVTVFEGPFLFARLCGVRSLGPSKNPCGGRTKSVARGPEARWYLILGVQVT